MNFFFTFFYFKPIFKPIFELHFDFPTHFFPSRWLEHDRAHQIAWMPFGAGPRTCIGMRLAQLEEKLMLARILKEYDIVECAETEVDPKIDPQKLNFQKELKLFGSAALNPEAVTIKLEKRY